MTGSMYSSNANVSALKLWRPCSAPGWSKTGWGAKAKSAGDAGLRPALCRLNRGRAFGDASANGSAIRDARPTRGSYGHAVTGPDDKRQSKRSPPSARARSSSCRRVGQSPNGFCTNFFHLSPQYWGSQAKPDHFNCSHGMFDACPANDRGWA